MTNNNTKKEKTKILVPGAENKWEEFKRFYGIPYIIVSIVNPTLLIFTVPEKMPFLTIISFYLLFGLIWPITYFTYPVFLMALENEFGLTLLGCVTDSSCLTQNITYVSHLLLVYLSFAFPIIIYAYYIRKHLKYIESIVGEPVPLISILDRFIR